MDNYDVTKIGLLFAIQSEVEGMKVANSERDLPSEEAVYTEADFQAKAEELRNIAYCHNEQL